MRTFIVLIASSIALLAQSGGKLDPRDMVRRSIVTGDRSYKAGQQYTYTERDEEKRLGSHGRVKSTEVDVSKVVFINGEPFEQLVEHNGGPPTPSEQKKEQDKIQKRRNETGTQRAARLRKETSERAFLHEVPEAFDFKLIGEETINGRPAYVLAATPHPGYQPRSKQANMFSKVQGKLWVDKEDFGWMKIDAQVMQPFAMGFFLARVQKGSRIHFEQIRVAPGVWLPKRIEVCADAKIMFVKNYDMNEVITYSNYQKAGNKTEVSSASGPVKPQVDHLVSSSPRPQ